MATRPPDLPDFARPPLIEVALSVQFQPLERLRIGHLGLFWGSLRERFPVTEERPPLPRAVEGFELSPAPMAQIRFEMLSEQPLPRFWMLDAVGKELIQVQNDRFVRNWRKVRPTEPYPRYESIRANFSQDFHLFEAFLSAESLGSPVIDQCEVTYVNHIEANQVWQQHGQIGLILRDWSRREAGHYLPEPEDVLVQERFVMRSADGKPLGRLHVRLVPSIRPSDQAPIYVLTMTARGTPLGDGFDGAMAFMDLGREWIVKGFADLTTADLQQVWGRNDG